MKKKSSAVISYMNNSLKLLLIQVALLPLPYVRFAECGAIYLFLLFSAAKPTLYAVCLSGFLYIRLP